MSKITMNRSIAGLKYPALASIKGRSSTIRAEFIKSVIPEIIPNPMEIEAALTVLQQNERNLSCSYCGDNPTEWDHFFSAVSNKRATGYITEVYNLVPACGKCNQSKGATYWKDWICGKAILSPTSRLRNGKLNITKEQLEIKIGVLEDFEKWGRTRITKLDFDSVSGHEFAEYFKSCEDLIDKLAAYERTAIALKAKVEATLQKRT
ncbi:HNH endonuclease [Hymenobacter properus]|uniref:HNH endonuclease n=1 Tax=Hymenobacter properus TaxID=2791026 RepID=A0A931FKU9_9BACT|nr:HNH endonuclease [Hymenobacter properus]MBF9144312.1 HNH endonuclease [Hymenobacter properus]MBR7723130.1 HNH endonuclease [Microvirga sp. SRT04]